LFFSNRTLCALNVIQIYDITEKMIKNRVVRKDEEEGGKR